MPKHRSLSNALLTPERRAFIEGREPTPAEPLADDPPETPGRLIAASETPSNASSDSDAPQQPELLAPSSGHDAPTLVTVPDDAAFRVAITTRLTPRTADALRRAHLEQKLHRREPATQQEIIETAVQSWLRQHAYLD